jgi:hypothetical protein
MEIFINKEFCRELEEAESRAFKSKDRRKLVLIEKIYNLLHSGLKINTNIDYSFIETGIDETGQKDFMDGEGVLALSLLKSNAEFIQSDLFTINKNNSFYFIGGSSLLIDNCGVVLINGIENKIGFYSDCTVNSFEIKEDYSIIEKSTPPCSSLFIVDKYLFADSKKILNVIRFIKAYKSDALKIPFQLTILSSYENNNKPIPPTVFNNYLEEFDKLDNLEYEILLDNRIPFDDRLIYTNYTKGSIGHPFDNRSTVFNQNFIGNSDFIIRDYNDYHNTLEKWFKFCNKISNNIGIITTRYSNSKFKNRIFTDLGL